MRPRTAPTAAAPDARCITKQTVNTVFMQEQCILRYVLAFGPWLAKHKAIAHRLFQFPVLETVLVIVRLSAATLAVAELHSAT